MVVASEKVAYSPPRRLYNGHFLPGVSGNPGGRPARLERQIREATRNGADLVTFLLAALAGYMLTRVPGQPDAYERVKPEHRLEAAQLLLDRGWGRAVQQVAVDVELRAYAEVIAARRGIPVERVLTLAQRLALDAANEPARIATEPDPESSEVPSIT